MNKLQKLLLMLSIFGIFIACQKEEKPVEVPTPSLEKVYSTQELDSLFLSYTKSNGKDIGTPPAAINNAFAGQFKNAYDIEWETYSGLYEVSFEIKDIDYDAVYDSAGNLLLYKYDIPSRKLPDAVQATITAQYNGYRVDDVNKVHTSRFICYDIEIEKGEQGKELYVREDGVVISERVDY